MKEKTCRKVGMLIITVISIPMLFSEIVVGSNGRQLSRHQSKNRVTDGSPRCPYERWVLECDGFGIEGPEAMPTEIWRAELQNGKPMGLSSVICKCNTTSWGWVAIKDLTWNGQSCTCEMGETIWTELDHSTCKYGQSTYGYYYLQS